PNHAPLRNHRPDEREVMLVDLVVILDVVGLAWFAEVAAVGPAAAGLVVTHSVVAIAIANVDDLVRIVSRLVVPHGAAGTGAVAVRIPVERRSEVPVAVVAIHVLEGNGRYRRLFGFPVAIVDAWHLYLAVF